jgi:hypothetical protein
MLLCGLALIPFLASEARANPAYEIAYTTFSMNGVKCSSGAVTIQLNPSQTVSRIAGYFIQNHGANDVFIGDVDVSTKSSVGNDFSDLGTRLAQYDTWVVPVFKDPENDASSNPPLVGVYCLAADAAGANGSPLTVIQFGY